MKQYKLLKEIQNINPISDRVCKIGTKSDYEHPYYRFEYSTLSGDTNQFGMDGKYFMCSNPEDYPEWFELVLPVSEPTPPNLNTKDTGKEYRANFLWGFEDGSIEALGYEFANGKTEEYLKEVWNDLVEKIKSTAQPTNDNAFVEAPEPSALPTKEWEIVSFRGTIDTKQFWSKYPDGRYKVEDAAQPYTFSYLMDSYNDGQTTIHSVRRLKEDWLLEVGSKDYAYGKPCKILSFRVMKNGCMWCCVEFENGNKYENLNILALDKLPITDHPTQPVETISSDNSDVACLSLNDVVEALMPIDSRAGFKNSVTYEILNNIVKEKLKQ